MPENFDLESYTGNKSGKSTNLLHPVQKELYSGYQYMPVLLQPVPLMTNKLLSEARAFSFAEKSRGHLPPVMDFDCSVPLHPARAGIRRSQYQYR